MAGELTGNDILSRVQARIGGELEQVEKIFREELHSWHPYVTDVTSHVARFRGKRLRPILLLLVARACGGIRHEHRVLAAVVEMIHTATLVHDDVLDDANTRRHVATVNSRWNNETSVLCGDFLFTHAFHLAASLDSALACRLIGRATNLVCEGELAQIHERGNLELDEATYFRIIEGKTAELCALCSFLGAHFADCSEEQSKALEGYGRKLGLAFQIADDVLDLAGTEADTGKSLGSDFVQQKLTLPVIRLMETASDDDRALALEYLGTPNEDSIRGFRQLLNQYGCVRYAEETARTLCEEARSSLDGLPDSPEKQMLDELTEFVAHRSF